VWVPVTARGATRRKNDFSLKTHVTKNKIIKKLKIVKIGQIQTLIILIGNKILKINVQCDLLEIFLFKQ